jgi:hypothetical protein
VTGIPPAKVEAALYITTHPLEVARTEQVVTNGVPLILKVRLLVDSAS